MKFKNQLLPLAITGLLTLGFTSCGDDDSSSDRGTVENQVTIATFVSQNSDYSLLLAAAEYAGLDDELADENNNFTIFAPNNAAFTIWLDGAELTDFTPEQVAQVLLNHIIGTELKAAAVEAAIPTYQTTLATGPDNANDMATNISIFIDADFEINGQSNIISVDVYDASNGIIHAVDSVIDLPMISTFASSDDRLSTLVGALVAQDLVEAVDGLGIATVLAPYNDAFDALDAIPEGDVLTDVLTYHVINGTNYTASDIVDATVDVETLLGEIVRVTPGPLFTGSNNTAAASVIIANIQASNGIVHVIDTVLLPTIPEVSMPQ